MERHFKSATLVPASSPLLPDGSIRDRPGPEFQALLREAPDLVFLAWIGGGRPNAARGVRAALADLGGAPACFEGVALYAEWVTSPEEWQEFREEWRR